MSEFRDAIADALHLAKYGHRSVADVELFDYTDAILAMPEMQAIKRVLLERLDRYEWCGTGELDYGDLLHQWDMPDSVAKWVLS